MVSEELPMEDALSGCRGVRQRKFFLVAEKLDGGCPFWFQSSYQWRMSFLVSEELQKEDVLSAFRGARWRVPFWFQRSYRWRMPFQVSEELLMENALNGFRGVTDGECP